MYTKISMALVKLINKTIIDKEINLISGVIL